jgi:hypothetical protein
MENGRSPNANVQRGFHDRKIAKQNPASIRANQRLSAVRAFSYAHGWMNRSDPIIAAQLDVYLRLQSLQLTKAECSGLAQIHQPAWLKTTSATIQENHS